MNKHTTEECTRECCIKEHPEELEQKKRLEIFNEDMEIKIEERRKNK